MKNVISLILAGLISLQTPVAFAGEEDAGGGSGSDDSSYDSSPDPAPDDRDDSTQAENDATDEQGQNPDSEEIVGTGLTSADWDKELLAPDTDPVLSVLLGKSASNLTEASMAQSFGAALVSRPWALFLDLNGNGVRGDIWDGLMFKLLWGDGYDGTYTSSTAQSGVQSRFRGAKGSLPDIEVLRSKLNETNVLLLTELSDGRKYAPLMELASLAENGNSRGVREDQKIALSTLTLLALAQPLMTTDHGPLLGPFSSRTRDISFSIRSDLQAQFAGVSYYSGGNVLALQSSLNRLAAVLGMTEAFLLRHPEAGLSDETLMAVRGAIYFMGFEIKRLKTDKSRRNHIFKTLIQTMAKNSPLTMKIAANKATSKEAMSNLKEIVANVPHLNVPLKTHPKLRVAGSLLAAGIVMILWIRFGVPNILEASRGSFAGVAAAGVGAMALPSFAGLIANWLLTPKIPGLLDRNTSAFYESIICEKELVK